MAADRIHVSLSVDPQRVAEVVRSLAAAGMAVEQVLDEIGVVSGTVEAGGEGALAAVDGVEAVEMDRAFRLPPPDSPLQ